MIAVANHPPISLAAADNLTVKLGDGRIPRLRDIPASAALARYLDFILGPINGKETTT